MRLLSIILVIAFCVVVASPVHAADDDLIYVRIRLAFETTHSAVASEGSGAANHDQRVVVVRNWVTSPGTWVPRAIEFIKTQDATQLDTCTGDGVSGVPAYECTANGTQAAVDSLMSAYLSVLVAAGHGG